MGAAPVLQPTVFALPEGQLFVIAQLRYHLHIQIWYILVSKPVGTLRWPAGDVTMAHLYVQSIALTQQRWRVLCHLQFPSSLIVLIIQRSQSSGKIITSIFNKHIRQQGDWGKTTQAMTRVALHAFAFLNHQWISDINPIRRLVFTERTWASPSRFFELWRLWFQFPPSFKCSLNLL